MNQEKASGRLGYPLFSLRFPSQMLELAQKSLKENQILWSRAVEKKGGIEEKKTQRLSALKKVMKKRCSRHINTNQLIFHLFHAITCSNFHCGELF